MLSGGILPGVQGRSGAPGRPKPAAHRERIAAAMRAYWASPEGQAERVERQADARAARLARRQRRM